MPPTPVPIGSSQFYRWMPHPIVDTPPSDATWRKPVPRGRIRDLVAAFDQCSGMLEQKPPPPPTQRVESLENEHIAPPPTSKSSKIPEILAKKSEKYISPYEKRHFHGRRGTQAVVFNSNNAQNAPNVGGAYPYGATPLKLRNLAQKMDKEELYVADDVGISKKSENFENSDDDVANFQELLVLDEVLENAENSENLESQQYDEESTLNRTFQDSGVPENQENLLQLPECPKTPKFTSSPTLFTPYAAGEPIVEYRCSSGSAGGPLKIVVKKLQAPIALATSTPKPAMCRPPKHSEPPPAFQDSFVSSISNWSAVDHHATDSRRQMNRLLNSIDETRHHILLAEHSLLEAQKSKCPMQELASQRVLLICRERLKVQLEEVRRLQAMTVVRHPPPPINRHFKSTMVISNISLQFNKHFHSRGSYAFLVLLKCRTEVEATGVVTLLAQFQTPQNFILFGEHLRFSNLPVDFTIGMEIYMMRVPEHRPPEKTCAAFLAQKVRNLLVPSNAAHRRPTTSTPQKSIQNATSPACDFQLCGNLTLDRDSSGDNRRFYLDDVIYPLEGTVKLNSHCTSLPDAIDMEYRGFLHILHDSASPLERAKKVPIWHKYWSLLHRGAILFWSTPQEEVHEKVPIFQIDLTKCTNNSIEESREMSQGAEHEFHIELLIDQDPDLIEKRRVILAAESSDHLNSWLSAINDTLDILRS